MRLIASRLPADPQRPVADRLHRCVLVALLWLLPCWTGAGEVLDHGFADRGWRAFSERTGVGEVVGACPSDDGGASILALQPDTLHWHLMRVRADGALDGDFADGGISTWLVSAALDASSAATACVGLGNGDPDDDRLFVVLRSPQERDFAFLALVDLARGGWDPDFHLGGWAQHDYSGLLFPSDAAMPFPRLRIGGAFPEADGGWLVSGSLGNDAGERRGFIARLSPLGAIEALAHPATAAAMSLDVRLARRGADGKVRALATVAIDGDPTWGLLRLDAGLQSEALSASGTPDGLPFELQRGRRVGGGLMVAAALASGDSATGTAPRLLVVRGDAVQELALPQPPGFDGEPLGVIAAAATGAPGDRVVFAGALASAAGASAGYYLASVRLGDGQSLPDALDPAFGVDGIGAVRYRPPASACRESAAPEQWLAGIVAWGEHSLLVGATAADCDDPTPLPLAARIDSASLALLRDGFE